MSELTPIRIDKSSKDEIRILIKRGYFSTMTEFVKDSVRKNLEEYRKKQVLKALSDNLGSLKVSSLTKEERVEAIEEALNYKGDIFKDIGLK